MFNMEDFEAHQVIKAQQAAAHLKTIRQTLREKLLVDALLNQDGEAEASMEYNGYGDSGQIQDCTSDDEEVQEFLWDMMWALHAGFENNEGGQGTVTWNLTKDEITVDHGENFISTVDTVTVL